MICIINNSIYYDKELKQLLDIKLKGTASKKSESASKNKTKRSSPLQGSRLSVRSQDKRLQDEKERINQAQHFEDILSYLKSKKNKSTAKSKLDPEVLFTSGDEGIKESKKKQRATRKKKTDIEEECEEERESVG